MRLSRTVLLAGVAALGLAGIAGLADAQTSNTHVMTVQLPNGAIEQIRYSGDVPPQIVLAPSAATFESPFAALEQMTAMMNRQAEAMLRSARAMAMQPMPVPMTEAAFGQAAPGPGVCMRSVQITYTGNGGPPHVVSRTAGDCGSSGGSAVPAELPAPVAPVVPAHPRTIEVKAGSPDQRPVNRVAELRTRAAQAVD
nr:hypothetical protein [uncultured Rhodopila sp.]